MESIDGEARFDTSVKTPTNDILLQLNSTNFPDIPPYIHLSLTIAFTVFYSFLFVLVYIQLLLILWYKHKRFSYQSVFLFLCLIWAALRTTLFSFYFKSSVVNNNLPGIPFWLLYCFPVCLQFVTLALLVLYFSQVIISAKSRDEPLYFGRNFLRIGVIMAVAIFLATNIISAIVIRMDKVKSRQFDGVITVRVVINELLFLICGVSLAVCVYKLTKITSTKIILETKGKTMCQIMTTCALIIFIYVSRAVYNIVVVAMAKNAAAPSFNFGWINATNQNDLKGVGYITFGVVLFIWEFLPTFIVVFLFRVKRPVTDAQLISDISNQSYNSQAHYFNNPRRYDSDDDLSKGTITSNNFYGTGKEYHIVRTNRYPSPYGSFQSGYVLRYGSPGHSSRSSAIGSVVGSPRDRLSPPLPDCSSQILRDCHSPAPPAAVINFHRQYYSSRR